MDCCIVKHGSTDAGKYASIMCTRYSVIAAWTILKRDACRYIRNCNNLTPPQGLLLE